MSDSPLQSQEMVAVLAVDLQRLLQKAILYDSMTPQILQLYGLAQQGRLQANPGEGLVAAAIRQINAQEKAIQALQATLAEVRGKPN